MTETIKENKTLIDENTDFNNLYTTERIETTMSLKHKTTLVQSTRRNSTRIHVCNSRTNVQ